MKKLFLISIIWAVCATAFGQDQFHHANKTPMINYDSLFAKAITIHDSEEGQAIIDRCIERYGGRKLLESLNSCQLFYKMKPFGANDSINIVKSFQRGRKFKILRNPEARTQESIINGNKSWFQSPETLYAVQNKQYKTWLFSYLSASLPLPLLIERFDDIRLGKRESSSLNYIYMDIKDSLLFVIGIDPSDGFIKSSEGIIRDNGKNSVYVFHFSDIREHDGYFSPHVIKTVSMGLEVSASRLSDIKINTQLTDDEFTPNKFIQKKKHIDMLK